MPSNMPPQLPPAITAEERKNRLVMLRSQMELSGTEAIFLTPGSNLRYFTGVSWGETERLVCALVTPKELTFVCPKFEDTALIAATQIEGAFAYWEEDQSPYRLADHLLSDHGVTVFALDPNCSFGHGSCLQEATTGKSMRAATDLFHQLRQQKSPAELALLQAAKDLTLDVHKQVFEWLKPGIRASEVKAHIDHLHRAGGADNGSYFCAVQFGEATSHPHGVPGDQVLQKDDVILIDTGCRLDGYHSDITRTYALTPLSPEHEALWALEKKAQLAAFDAAQIGVPCAAVDDRAREILVAAGLGPDYQLPGLPHRTGHGIGLDIHEGPYLVRGDTTPLAPGMCFSNEPMIVIPDRFGIRLEDHFYMSEQGPVWFTEPQAEFYRPFG